MESIIWRTGGKDKVEFGTGSLYVDQKKVANAEDFWSKVDFDTEAPPGIHGHFVACLPDPDPFDTTLTLNLKKLPTAEENGIVEIKTVYADEETERTHFGSESTKDWYRSVNGGGYQECTAYNGNFANYGNVFEDRNITLGANSCIPILLNIRKRHAIRSGIFPDTSPVMPDRNRRHGWKL